ncbi:MAG: hypothetical protein K0Q59_5578 [Paenibacillus sp.]|nr:hypothetical protein [Paenibacillus sp.]
MNSGNQRKSQHKNAALEEGEYPAAFLRQWAISVFENAAFNVDLFGISCEGFLHFWGRFGAPRKVFGIRFEGLLHFVG